MGGKLIKGLILRGLGGCVCGRLVNRNVDIRGGRGRLLGFEGLLGLVGIEAWRRVVGLVV